MFLIAERLMVKLHRRKDELHSGFVLPNELPKPDTSNQPNQPRNKQTNYPAK
jgi:hypothetical protein